MTAADDTPSPTGDAALASFDAYAAGRDDPLFSEWLRERSEPSWSNAIDHRFVDDLAGDALDDAVFRRYLVQDAAFVRELTGAFGHAVGDAPTPEARRRLVEFLETLTTDENDYFERAFDALDVPDATVEDPTLAAPTRAFRDLLGRATAGGYPELLAVLVPAEWTYCTWATTRADREPDRWYLDEWIALHANSAFESFVDWLRAELDREGAAASPRRQHRLAALFERTVALEVAFFDAAYDDAPDHDGAAPCGGPSTRTDGGERSW